MKKTAVLFIFCVLCCPLRAATLGPQSLVPAGHWIYDAVTRLYLEQGRSSFTGSAPLTAGELSLYLREIDYGTLSPAGRSAYDSVAAYLSREYPGFDSGLVSAGIQVEAALEGYFKTNREIDWQYVYQRREPLLNVPLWLNVGDYMTLYTEVTAAQNIETMCASGTWWNVPFPLSQFDVNFPHTAYLSTGVMFAEETGINMKIFRGAQSIGRTATGSVILSDYVSNESAAELSVFSPYFRYGMNITQLNPPRENNPDPAYLYTHRFEIRLFDKLTFTALEGVLVNAPLELRFLNPLMIWHGYASWNDYYGTGSDESSTNKEASLLGLALDVIPCPGLRLYAVYAQNQFQTAYERKHWPDSAIPNALAVQGGLEFSVPVGSGWLHGGAEGVYTSPYMYLMEGKDWSFIREYNENIGGTVQEWVGTPFGPDSIAASATVGYQIPGKWQVSGRYTFSVRGEKSEFSVLDTDYWPENADAAAVSTPTGIPVYCHALSLCGIWYPMDNIRLMLCPAYTVQFNAGHIAGKTGHGFECSVSGKISVF